MPARRYTARCKKLRAGRSSEVARCFSALRKAPEGSANLKPYIRDAVTPNATPGEICGALRDVFGSYTEVSIT